MAELIGLVVPDDFSAPDWSGGDVHHWTRYVPTEVQEAWHRLPVTTRAVAARVAEYGAMLDSLGR